MHSTRTAAFLHFRLPVPLEFHGGRRRNTLVFGARSATNGSKHASKFGRAAAGRASLPSGSSGLRSPTSFCNRALVGFPSLAQAPVVTAADAGPLSNRLGDSHWNPQEA